MFQISVGLSEDRKTANVHLPTMASAQPMSADELSELIRQLAWVRTSMEPQHPAVDITPETLISNVPAVRYQVVEDDVPDQCRLFLLHPGFGWLYIHLPREAVTKIATDAQMFFRKPTATQ